MAYLGFAASAAVRVNPDVLSHDGALLVEAHVLHKLQCKVSICSRSDEESERSGTHILRIGDVGT